MHSRFGLLAAVALAAGFSTAAFAADPAPCGPLKQIAATIPLTETATKVFVMPVSLNGVDKKMLLDTGGMYSALTPATTDALKLKRINGSPFAKDIANRLITGVTSVADFRIGGMKGTNVPFMILPADEKNFDGLMALAQLDQFDVDADFGARTLKFMSPDHCKGHVMYWQGPTGIIPIRLTDQHAYTDVVLDGVKFHAMIDTGSTRTILYNNQAEAHFGLTEDSKDIKQEGDLRTMSRSGEILHDYKIYSHTFKNLDFEGVTVRNPTIEIFHQFGGESYEDMILGMDVLSKLHLYFAFKEGTLYVSPGTSPPPDAPKPDAPKLDVAEDTPPPSP